MKKYFVCLALVIATFITGTWAHAGPTFNACKNAICTGQSGKTFTGCRGYFQLRITHGQNRDKAKSDCYWNCNRYYGTNPVNKNNCNNGCNLANQKDN
jgi:hypothetical protein